MPDLDLTNTILRLNSAMAPFRAILEVADVLAEARNIENLVKDLEAKKAEREAVRDGIEAEIAVAEDARAKVRASLAASTKELEQAVSEARATIKAEAKIAADKAEDAKVKLEAELAITSEEAARELAGIKSEIAGANLQRETAIELAKDAQSKLDALTAAIARITGVTGK